MKKIIYSLVSLLCLAMTTSCNDWLDIKPNNEQITDDYWKSKEDVESVVASGYYYMRTCVPTFIKWGELRGGTFYSRNTADTKLQDFNLTTDYALCSYADVYKVINAANSVIAYAPGVRGVDNTYYEAIMNSHLCEAYFQRAYSYLILLKNYGSVPLVLKPYVDDNESFDIPKSTDSVIVAQIKSDVETALATGAAKGTYETDWQTKGRATKWALYALMADVCLWSEDYDKCIEYCDKILEADDAFRPAFLSNTNDWYTIFYPGNSNESIFELNWDYNTAQETNNFTSLWSLDTNSRLVFTKAAAAKMAQEMATVFGEGTVEGRVGRTNLATFIQSGNDYYLWKYRGTDIQDVTGGLRTHLDANFILYRVAEIILMKAQAEVMKGNFKEALVQLNSIRKRAGLGNYSDIDPEKEEYNDAVSMLDEQTLLEEILEQKQMEFMGEAKRWYDLMWFGKIRNYKYKEQFITEVLEGNETTNQSWIRSVLVDPNAWYMPIPQSDIEHNSLLTQNPYYTTN